jgi:excisionase family DNA binding protein
MSIASNQRAEPSTLQRVLTPKQVMDLLNISENTAYRELQYGFLADIAFRVGRQWRVSSDALDHLMSGSK